MDYEKETERIEEYQRIKGEYLNAEHGLGKLKIIKHLPYPNQVIGGVLAILLLLVGAAYLPQIIDFIVLNWMPDGIDNRMMFMFACGWALMFTGLFFVVMFFGGPIKPFLKARIGGKDVVELMTQSGKKIYMNQKDEVGGVYEIGKDMSVEVDPNSFYSGPGGVRMTTIMPEVPITFNPRHTVQGYKLGLDMMTLKTYGMKHEQKQWEKMKSGKEWMQPFIMPLIIFFVIGLVLGPYFYRKMDDTSTIGDLRQEIQSCKVDLITAGVVPDNLKQPTTEKTGEVDSSALKPASTGASIKK